MLGDNILIAPVTAEGATTRDIYLPAGIWRDVYNGNRTYTGPLWLWDYPAPLHILPFFVKQLPNGTFMLQDVLSRWAYPAYQ